jgi:ABC-type sugar transport system permease subunit
MMAYRLCFGLLAAVATIAYPLFSAYQEVEVLQTPVPKNSLGFQDYTYSVRSAEYFASLVTLPTDVIILVCVTIAAFLSARHTRNRSAGFGVALITFFFSFALYATASVLVAKYLLEPAIPLGRSLSYWVYCVCACDMYGSCSRTCCWLCGMGGFMGAS